MHSKPYPKLHIFSLILGASGAASPHPSDGPRGSCAFGLFCARAYRWGTMACCAGALLLSAGCDICELGFGAPTANAGADQNVKVGQQVTLDGSASTDPDGDALTYLWQQTCGPVNVNLTNPNGAMASFVPQVKGVYCFTLTVSDGCNSDEDTVQIPVFSDPDIGRPLANAGSDFTVNEGERSICLTGINSADPNGRPLTFSWMQLSGREVSLSNPFVAEVCFDAPEDVCGDQSLVFELTVVNDIQLRDKDEVAVTVRDLDGECCTSDVDCDDNRPCTEDTCDTAAGSCVFTLIQCPEGQTCNEMTGECDACSGVICDDEDACTGDTCVDGACVNDPIDIDDDLFCTGTETCDPATGEITSSGNPCEEGTFCNEDTDTCDPDDVCTTIADCDDDDPCTTDECVNGTCTHQSVDPICGDGACTCGETSVTCPSDCACSEDSDCDDRQAMYWADAGTHKIQRANLDGTNIEDLITAGLDEPSGIALNVGNGKMYWPDFTADKIQRANLVGSCVEDLVTGSVEPSLIALDLAAEKMYWGVSGKIQRSNLDGSNVEEFVVEGLSCPRGSALDLDADKIYWSDRCTGKIQRTNLDGSGLSDLVTGLVVPLALALDLTAGKLYWAEAGTDEIGSGDGKVRRVNLDGSAIEDLVTGLEDPQGIALDLEEGKIYWTDAGTDKIQRANLEIPEGDTPDNRTDIDDLVTAGLEQPRGIALDLGKATICVEGACVPTCTSDTDCNDGDLCTMDQCTAGACVNTSVDCPAGETCNVCTGECGGPCTDASQCDDGLFCNGVEFCLDDECQACTSPCAASQTCDEQIDECAPNGAPGDAIHSGETVVDSINPEADTDPFTFTAEAGTTAVIQVSPDFCMAPCIDLFAPGGGAPEVSLCGPSCQNAFLQAHRLQQSGQYTILVRDDGGNDTDEYSLSLLLIPGPTVHESELDGGSICSGQTREGAIDPEADTDAFTFTGDAGTTAVIQVSPDFCMAPCIDLFAPGGGAPEVSLCGPSCQNAFLQAHSLQQSGQYTIVVRDDGGNDTNEYSVVDRDPVVRDGPFSTGGKNKRKRT